MLNLTITDTCTPVSCLIDVRKRLTELVERLQNQHDEMFRSYNEVALSLTLAKEKLELFDIWIETNEASELPKRRAKDFIIMAEVIE